jgi:hypothetical protein
MVPKRPGAAILDVVSAMQEQPATAAAADPFAGVEVEAS